MHNAAEMDTQHADTSGSTYPQDARRRAEPSHALRRWTSLHRQIFQQSTAPRVLVNDWLGTRLAEMIGLPVPVPAIVDVHPWLVEHTPDLRLELCGRRTMFTPGLSFGSRYVVSPLEGQVYDYLPEAMIGRVRNICSFAGILALDKWTCNADGRQVAFWKRPRERKFNASFIDQGYFSTQASGASPTRHCAASSGVTTFMPALQSGTASSRG